MYMGDQRSLQQPPQSYWLASTPQTDYPSLKENLNVDVAIIGGGITGISCAYLLNKAGLTTAILEADRILQGTTGHTTAKVTSQHGLIYSKIKNQMSEELAWQYANANESAIRMIQEIAQENQIDCDYVPQSAYIYTLESRYVDKISDEAKAASSLGISATFLQEIPLSFPVKAAVRFDNQAQFHPRKFLLAVAKKFSDNGGMIFEQSRIVDIEEDGSGYVIATNQGIKVKAKKLIIASRYPCYNKSGLYFSRLYRSRSYVVAVKAKENYPGGMYISFEKSGHSFRNQMSDLGELILVGGEAHKTGQGGDTTKHYKAIIDFSNKAFTVEDIPYRNGLLKTA